MAALREGKRSRHATVPRYRQECSLLPLRALLRCFAPGSLRMEPHPFGVQPLGNCFASCGAAGVAEAVRRGASGDPVRSAGLGDLAALPDELLLALLGALEPRDLAALCCVSRAARAFAAHDELWRFATLERFGGDFRFTRTWRETYR